MLERIIPGGLARYIIVWREALLLALWTDALARYAGLVAAWLRFGCLRWAGASTFNHTTLSTTDHFTHKPLAALRLRGAAAGTRMPGHVVTSSAGSCFSPVCHHHCEPRPVVRS